MPGLAGKPLNFAARVQQFMCPRCAHQAEESEYVLAASPLALSAASQSLIGLFTNRCLQGWIGDDFRRHAR
jgi:hypothetical protein